jgi:hypothetical protein
MFHSLLVVDLCPDLSCAPPRKQIEEDERKIVNMFHQACEACRTAEFARRVGR